MEVNSFNNYKVSKKKSNVSLIEDSLRIISIYDMWNFDISKSGFFVKLSILEKTNLKKLQTIKKNYKLLKKGYLFQLFSFELNDLKKHLNC